MSFSAEVFCLFCFCLHVYHANVMSAPVRSVGILLGFSNEIDQSVHVTLRVVIF